MIYYQITRNSHLRHTDYHPHNHKHHTYSQDMDSYSITPTQHGALGTTTRKSMIYGRRKRSMKLCR